MYALELFIPADGINLSTVKKKVNDSPIASNAGIERLCLANVHGVVSGMSAAVCRERDELSFLQNAFP